MRVIVIIISLVLVFQSYLRAQPEQFSFSHLSTEKGLSHNQIKCLLKDNRGFMWFGTISGLNRFDGYSVKVFLNDPEDSTTIANNDINSLYEGPDNKIWINTGAGWLLYDMELGRFFNRASPFLREYAIPDGTITSILSDSKGNFWFVHATHGLFRYSPKTKLTQSFPNITDDKTSPVSSEISVIREGQKGNLWVVHRDGIFERIDINSGKVLYRNDELRMKTRGITYDYSLWVDHDNDPWIFIGNSNRGVDYFDTKKNILTHIDKRSAPWKITSDLVRGIVDDDDGQIWIATDHGGINILNKRDGSIKHILNEPDRNKSLSQNSINVLYKDDQGIIWAGSYKKGVDYYHKNIFRFSVYSHLNSDASSLPFEDINSFAEDKNGNLWIGTNGGGLVYFDRHKNTFTQYLNEPGNRNSISSNVIVSLFLDHENILWIGTFYGGLNRFDGKKFTHYRHDPLDPGSILDDSIWEIYEDSENNLWIGTFSKGVDVLDPQRKTFRHYRAEDPNSIHASYIPAFMEDKNGNMWIGTGYGIDLLKKGSNRFQHFLNNRADPSTLSNNSILSIIQDSRGLIWIGTHGGLNLYNPKRETFRVFKESNGLSHNSMMTILEDEDGTLWLGTPNGLSNARLLNWQNIDSLTLSVKRYDESDGLQGKHFNENAGLRTSSGELVFGGANGFNVILPAAINPNAVMPKVMLTDLQVFNKSLGAGDKLSGKVVLDKEIGSSEKITLNHSENVFSIEFVAINFFHPEKTKYQYRLEGFNKDWLTTDGTQRKVTYTNLDPGTYTFLVNASTNDGVWSDRSAGIEIEILPPFWKTKTAFVLYTLVILGALLLSRRLIQERERMKFRLEKEHQLHELDMIKLKFFTNVSHEFRTPLTLILTPLEKMLKNASDPLERNQFQLIYRNAKRVLNLVNQLLDFRRLEVQEVTLNSSEGDIVQFVKDTTYSFSDLSEKKEIRFSFATEVDSLETLFDRDKVEKILFNLLSNAFKFTPEGGEVAVHVKPVIKSEDNSRWLAIAVKDSGIGIPKEKHAKIFERFFQNDLPKSMVNQGSGIGLSITSEFVKAHGGTITVESEPDNGSCFTVMLPVKEIAVQQGDLQVEVIVPSHFEEVEKTTDGEQLKPVLLLIDDNEDFRFYLKDNMKTTYQIVEARNGREGLQTALRIIPDLIVSDVMMPEMDGMELCRKIKQDRSVSHIPVILLTARAAEEKKMEGFETGADDYITKPFNFEILMSRIRNLIALRQRYHKALGKQMDIKASDLNITSLDEKLIKNAIACVEENVSDPDFSVEELSHKLGMSRVHLYKKLLSLTGKSPIEFIRTIRLQQAAQLLEKSQLSVSEVAYKVGFNNPKYFTKYFKEEYQILPSLYAASKSGTT